MSILYNMQNPMKCHNDTSQYQPQQRGDAAKHQPSHTTLTTTDLGSDDINKKHFNPSYNNLSNRPAESNPSNNADQDPITRNLDQKTKMELIQNKKCLLCRNKGQHYKDYRKRLAKQPMVTTAQALSIRRESRLKGLNKDTMKERPKFKAKQAESTHFSKVLVKANGHPALTLVDLQTQAGDLVDATFVHLYRTLTISIERKVLTTTIKGFQVTIDKECTIRLDWIGYLEELTDYVSHLSRCDMMLGE